MSEVPSELKFLSTHEWVLIEDNIATVGVSDHAQELLGDLVYVELPEKGSTIAAGDSVGVIESVKAASDVYAPVSGEVIEINEDLEGAPDIINNDAYGDGWMYKVAMEDPEEVGDLLDATGYADSIADDD
jgi:glycine cleavage system H protein